jgi:hypothetical protein
MTCTGTVLSLHPPWSQEDSTMTSNLALIEAVSTWLPRGPLRPAIELEPRPNGLRVKLTYLGVETGVLFAWDGWGSTESVQRSLDQVFEILSWRVTSPPAAQAG